MIDLELIDANSYTYECLSNKTQEVPVLQQIKEKNVKGIIDEFLKLESINFGVLTNKFSQIAENESTEIKLSKLADFYMEIGGYWKIKHMLVLYLTLIEKYGCNFIETISEDVAQKFEDALYGHQKALTLKHLQVGFEYMFELSMKVGSFSIILHMVNNPTNFYFVARSVNLHKKKNKDDIFYVALMAARRLTKNRKENMYQITLNEILKGLNEIKLSNGSRRNIRII